MKEDLIYDLGFHIGQDTDFYLKKGFRVIAIEANPILFSNGKIKFKKYIDSGQLDLINIGIAYENSTLPFYVNQKNSEWSSFDYNIGTSRGDYTVIEIKVVTLDTIIAQHQVPYYLKIDIEGYDRTAVNSLKKIINKPKFISTESSDVVMIEELSSLGYQKFKFINQANINQITLKYPAKEGAYVKHDFIYGSSGPFGEETEGSWLSKETIINLSNAYWGNPQRDTNIHGWYDLHASF